jgi:signal transduction histidine kinase
MKSTKKNFYKGLLYGLVLAAGAYFAYVYQTQLKSFYHGRLALGWQHLWDPAYPFLAWTLFSLLALAMIFFVFQAWQEQYLLESLTNQLKREKNLLDQKRNFVTLTSHYLRTPLALITNGTELLASLKVSPDAVSKLSTTANQLKTNVDSLLKAVIEQPGNTAQPKPPRGYMVYIFSSIAGAFVAIISAVYILANQGLYSSKLRHITYLAGLLVIAVIIYSAYRSHAARRLLKDHFFKLITDQRALDSARNDLMTNGLESLKQPINQLHSELAGLHDSNATRPVEEGLARFEAILQKFIILAGLRTGSMQTARQKLDLSRIVADMERRYSPLLQSKNSSIQTDIKAKTINSDALLMEYVLDSLINNSLKFGAGGRPIAISSKKGRKKTVHILVADKGPGIPEAKLALIFQPFSRAEDAAKDFEHEGIGLSLYLDKLILQYLGGVITTEKPKGKGAIFRLSVPA